MCDFQTLKVAVFQKDIFIRTAEKTEGSKSFIFVDYLSRWEATNRGVFRTLSDIYDGAFCKKSSGLTAVNYKS